MPVDHSKNAFFNDLGTDWLALDAAGEPLARAATEEGVRHAAPGAAEYVSGKKTETAKPVSEPAKQEKPKQEKPKQEEPKQEKPKQEKPKQEEPTDKPQLDHDGDGKPGGSQKGENATARKRKPTT